MALAPVSPPAPAVLPEPDRPAAASRRGYLREALPPVYRDRSTIAPPLVERWVAALEEVLDPVVLQLDSLAAHLDPALTEGDWINTLTQWLGMRVDREVTLDIRRARVAEAMTLNRTRGTLLGLRRALEVTFPGAGIRAEHNATATTGTDPLARPPATTPELVITVPQVLAEQQRRVLLRLVEDQRPAHVPWRLDEPAPAPEPGST